LFSWHYYYYYYYYYYYCCCCCCYWFDPFNVYRVRVCWETTCCAVPIKGLQGKSGGESVECLLRHYQQYVWHYSATLLVVYMTFCDLTCGVSGIIIWSLWCEWHYCMISMVWMALLYDLCGVNGIIVWSLWCEWHYCM